MRLKPSLRVLSLQKARTYFGLKKSHVQRLPALHLIAGNYMFSHTVKVPPQLVSTAAVKELGISVHGSPESLEDNLLRRLKSKSSRVIGRFYQRASMTPLEEDLLSRPGQGNIPTSECFGMASTPFPCLQPSGGIEDGLWCKGCQLMAELYRARKLDPTTLARIVPHDWEPDRVLHGMSRRARSKAEFVDSWIIQRVAMGCGDLIQMLQVIFNYRFIYIRTSIIYIKESICRDRRDQQSLLILRCID